MKIIIAGGTGFLGKALEDYFKSGNEVIILTRNPKRENEIYWNSKTLGEWTTQLENCDVLINFVVSGSFNPSLTEQGYDWVKFILKARTGMRDTTRIGDLRKGGKQLTTTKKSRVTLNELIHTFFKGNQF